MQKNIHPKFYDDAQIICSCGTVFKTGATLKKMSIEICSQCHPFYTGNKGKIIDTAGRVDRFKKIKEKSMIKKEVIKPKKIRHKKDKKIKTVKK